MSNHRKNERRREREAERAAEDAVRETEERRRAALSMWERIEEVDADSTVKEILHMLAAHMGLEQ